MIAVTDYCATLPRLICQHLSRNQRLRIVPAPVDLGPFPVEMGWHAHYRDDPAHRWFRFLIMETAQTLSDSQTNSYHDYYLRTYG